MKKIKFIISISLSFFIPVIISAQVCEEVSIFDNGGIPAETYFFGGDVSHNNSFMVVGALHGTGNVEKSGNAHLYHWEGSTWIDTIVYSSNGVTFEGFGRAVDIHNSNVIVGARSNSHNSIQSGSAFYYSWDGSLWNETKLFPSDGNNGDSFGTGVGIHNDFIVVGAPYDGDLGYNRGSAYIYEWDGNSWVETKIIASDGVNFDEFGTDIAIHQERIVVGTRYGNAVYVYEKSGASWIETKLIPSDGSTGLFGREVAIWGDRIIVSANEDNDAGTKAGAAYLYEWDGNSWVETKIIASDLTPFSRFGSDVDIQEDYFIVGTQSRETAYVFNRDCNAWLETKLAASDGGTGNNFGGSVSIFEGTAFVGAISNGTSTGGNGQAYLYDCIDTLLDVRTIAIENELCLNDCSGSINLCVNGGSAPYTYIWSNGQTSSYITNLCSGSYSVTITDNAGETIDSSFTIKAADPIISFVYDEDDSCFECTGFGYVAVTNINPPYSFLWSNGHTTDSYDQFCAGTYSVTVTDADGCTEVENISINSTVEPSASAGPNKEGCFGSSFTIGGNPTAAGGSPPYSYTWSNGQTAANINVFVNVTTSFSVTVTDANGCSDTDQVTVFINPLPYTDAGQDTTICPGESIQIGGSPTGSNGTAPYSYSWDNGLPNIANPIVNSPGTYRLTITDANGCQSTNKVIISQDPLATFWYPDNDGDGYGDDNLEIFVCVPPPGHISIGGDCDDNDPAITYLGAPCDDGLSCTSNTTVQADCSCGGVPVSATTNIFIGNGNQWTDASNWSLGIVPDYCHDVIIPGGKFVVLISGEWGKCNTLIVDQNSFLNIPPSANFEAVALYQQ